MEGHPGNADHSDDDYGFAHSSSRHTFELAQQSNQIDAAASSSSSPETCQYVDASLSLPSKTFGYACAPPHSKDACSSPFIVGSLCSSQVPYAHNPAKHNQRPGEEHEHHPSCSLTEDRQNPKFQGSIISESQAKVQITMKEARQRISQLVQRRQEDKQVGAQLLERLMQKIENRKSVRNLGLLLVSLVSVFKKLYGYAPWRNSLKEIEGKFGSAVLLTFVFLRFVLLLNAILSVLWIVAIVIPFLADPPKSFSWSQFFDIGFKRFIQGNGLEKSWIYYGGYCFRPSEQLGWYKTAYMYPCTIIASLLISWMAILTRDM